MCILIGVQTQRDVHLLSSPLCKCVLLTFIFSFCRPSYALLTSIFDEKSMLASSFARRFAASVGKKATRASSRVYAASYAPICLFPSFCKVLLYFRSTLASSNSIGLNVLVLSLRAS